MGDRTGRSKRKTYDYKTAGIQEHEGHVPYWLWVVIAGLLVWGVYYLVRYWHPPA